MPKELKPFPLVTKELILRERKGDALQDAELMSLIEYYELVRNLARRAPEYMLVCGDACRRLEKLYDFAKARKLHREED